MNPILAAVLASVALGVARVWVLRRRRWSVLRALGLSLDRAQLVNLGVGTAIAVLAIAVVFLASAAARTLTVLGVGPVTALTRDLLSFVAVPFQEELIFRTGLLGGLLVLLPRYRWAAIGISAVVFGGLHGLNANATALTVIGTSLGAVTYAIAFAATERLWLPIGLHFGWNWALGPLLGFALSGGKPIRGTFVHQVTTGPDWLTGGAYGPEGGALGLIGRVLVLVLVLAWLDHLRRGAQATPVTAAPTEELVGAS